MSLKAFHVVFVAVSILLLVGFGVWTVREYQRAGGTGNVMMAACAFLGAILLLWYGRWFLRKIKDERLK